LEWIHTPDSVNRTILCMKQGMHRLFRHLSQSNLLNCQAIGRLDMAVCGL
jgi:hypothetical protein